jgi:Ca2+/Na+ antiporter
MNATLLAFSNSAAECFIVMNSIFFCVSDIGIQTAVQQCAFSILFIQGLFYTYAQENTRIDWWISTRDSVLFVLYLCLMSYFMIGNQIEDYAVYILLIIYMIHVILMKMNHAYEVALKKGVASFMEVNELKRLAYENIEHFHYNLDSRFPSIEMLNKINFRQEGDILVFESNPVLKTNQSNYGRLMAKKTNKIRYKMKPI